MIVTLRSALSWGHAARTEDQSRSSVDTPQYKTPRDVYVLVGVYNPRKNRRRALCCIDDSVARAMNLSDIIDEIVDLSTREAHTEGLNHIVSKS